MVFYFVVQSTLVRMPLEESLPPRTLFLAVYWGLYGKSLTKTIFFVLASGVFFNLRYYDTFLMEIRPKSDIKDAHPDGEVCDPRPPVPAVEPPVAPRSFGKP